MFKHISLFTLLSILATQSIYSAETTKELDPSDFIYYTTSPFGKETPIDKKKVKEMIDTEMALHKKCYVLSSNGKNNYFKMHCLESKEKKVESYTVNFVDYGIFDFYKITRFF